MRTLVTGGGGFLGGCIARMLRDRGDDVTTAGRSLDPAAPPEGMRVRRLDVRDTDALVDACDGMDVVFHAAGITGIWGQRSTFFEINTTGTRNVIAACRQCGVGRLVYTSSPSVVHGKGDLCGVDESTPYPARHLGAYSASKAAAERLVLRANGVDLSTVAIRPHLVWGPGDPHLIPRIVIRARAGTLLQVGDGKNLVDIVYVDNAAYAHLLAADELAGEGRCAGRSYFVSQGEPVLLWSWLNGILSAIGVPPVTRRIPYHLAYALGGLLEVVYRIGGVRREPRMTRFLAVQLAKSHYFDISNARRDFSYEPRVSTKQGEHRLIEWLQHVDLTDPSALIAR